jgi:hypothetical protein
MYTVGVPRSTYCLNYGTLEVLPPACAYIVKKIIILILRLKVDCVGNHGVLFLVVGVVRVRAIGYIIVEVAGTVPVPSKKDSACNNENKVSKDGMRGPMPCAAAR